MEAQGEGWLDLDRDEWVRGRWPARCVTEPNVLGSSYSEGTLILTSRRLIFVGRTASDELAVLKAEELTRSSANDTVSRSTP